MLRLHKPIDLSRYPRDDFDFCIDGEMFDRII